MPDPSSKLPLIDLAAQRRRLAGRIEAAIARVVAHGQFILGPGGRTRSSRRSPTASASATRSPARAAPMRCCWRCWRAASARAMPSSCRPSPSPPPPRRWRWPAPCRCWSTSMPTSPSTRPASCEAIAAIGARAALRPRAVMPVDLFGQPARYESAAADRAGAGAVRAAGCRAELRRPLAGRAGRPAGRCRGDSASIHPSRSAPMAMAARC